MVPLEAEPPDGSADASPKEGAAAPITVLSRLAFKDALLELEASVRKTRDVSSAAVFQMWQVAERHLGVEVDIDDPALRGLFGLHVLAVEELCNRVRSQAEATLNAVEAWSQPQLGITAAGFLLLADSECGDGSLAGQAVAADLMDAEQTATEARARLVARLQQEVIDVLEQRLKRHADVREDVRERQRWGSCIVAARRDVAWLRREAPGAASGLRALSGRSSGPLEEAEARLQEASDRVSDLDSRLLKSLTELQAESVDTVRRPWAALVQIQAEFCTAQQATWVSLRDTFEEFAAGPSVAAGGSSSQ